MQADGTYGGYNSGNGPSQGIFGGSRVSDIIADPNKGLSFFDDFVVAGGVAAGAETIVGPYRGFASTGGAVAGASEVGGWLTFSSDGDDEGASIASETTPFEITQNAKRLMFEARVKSSTIANTKHGFFVGLIDPIVLSATVPITATGALADQNLVGFHRPEGTGASVDAVYKADGVAAVTVQSAAATLVADTAVKLGLAYDPSESLLTYYVNGVAVGTKTIPNATGTDFPADVTMGCVFGVLNATGTTPGSSSLDWWLMAQER